jgi:hypothetical protein
MRNDNFREIDFIFEEVSPLLPRDFRLIALSLGQYQFRIHAAGCHLCDACGAAKYVTSCLKGTQMVI